MVREQPGPRPLKWVLTVLCDVAEALVASYSTHVVHMDVKTDNIMVDDAVLSASGSVPEWCVPT